MRSVTAGTTAPSSQASQPTFKFVGGRLDGGELPVPQPTYVGMELRVRPGDPWEPREYYVLREDGRFHFEQSVGGAPALRRLGDLSPDDLLPA
jgi:hypothetical protein